MRVAHREAWAHSGLLGYRQATQTNPASIIGSYPSYFSMPKFYLGVEIFSSSPDCVIPCPKYNEDGISISLTQSDRSIPGNVLNWYMPMFMSSRVRDVRVALPGSDVVLIEMQQKGGV